MLAVGDSAPDFTLADQNGEMVSLKQHLGNKVLVWFYPKASTPGCTAEGCSLRDHMAELEAKGVKIIGISMDSVKRQSNFATKYEFPYTLLADVDGVAVHGFGAWGPKKFMGKEYDGIHRMTFIIDENGVVERVIDKVKTKDHAAQILE